MADWTCPFCALLCDRLTLDVAARGSQALGGSDCPRALRALAHFDAGNGDEQPAVQGKPVTLDAAIDAAAALLDAAHQPLFGGLATDIAGARSLYALANRCHAILDHANSDGLLPGLRTLQDRGLLQTTLAEVRNHADLMVVIGSQPSHDYPEFYRRCGVGDAVSQLRAIVFLGTAVDPASTGHAELAVATLPWDGDAYTTLALLNALVKRRPVDAPGALHELAQRMLAARYVVFVWEPGRLPGGPHAALLVESINQLAKTVNRTTRAGGIALAGNDGGLAVNQTLAWMSGLPLRTGVHASGLVHEPHRYGTDRLLHGRAVDTLLWVASFGPQTNPPTGGGFAGLPTILLAHPAHPARAEAGVFIPVATPGIGASGHLFRLDSVVIVPVGKALDQGLPGVAGVADAIDARLHRLRAEAA
jgi:formylmethanofuran dehydrogenase subunit B